MSFAVSSLHKDTPGYWEIITKFSFNSLALPSHEKVKLLCENVKYLESDAFNGDDKLRQEFMDFCGFKGHPLGIVLISSNDHCNMCGGTLLVRTDRPSFPVVYTEDYGTACGTHFRKYCQNTSKGCPFTQHYGFHSIGKDYERVYDKNCFDLPYFLSSHNYDCFPNKDALVYDCRNVTRTIYLYTESRYI